MIDYEWTFPEQIPAKELAYRALYCYLLEDRKRGKLPLDRGEGYSEEASCFIKDPYQGEHLIAFDLEVSPEVKTLRIDPAMDCCVVKLLELTWNGMEIDATNKRVMVVNGKTFGSDAECGSLPSIVFATRDPNINLRLERLARLRTNPQGL